ncbi:protein ALP1-like [Zea mays]|uniref:protein ALP1-like n=1 Tax=Zea mays TaxID=4577 RepID=UPI0009AAE3BD|nr:protein ALP1-like [Zea mays]|eukprot:XP_020395832.1 protein ALP1-like [Zea mays]
MSPSHTEDEFASSDSSDSEDETLLLVNLLTLNIAAQHLHRRRSGLPRRVIHRDHFAGENLIQHHYFAANPVYPPHVFRRRFRMSRPLFLRILQGLQQHDIYFTQRVDATGMPGLGPLQKVCAAMRILAYGLPSDAVDEYIQIGESTARECLHHFCRAIIDCFSAWYLRTPTQDDINRIMHNSESRGFPGMLGSIDCMHWEWRNCPTAWRGQFCGRNGRASMILEAVATYDLWIWHAFFGMPGTNNDVNVLHRSHVFDPITTGRMPPVNYTVNGNAYNFGYYLADGIYPNWPTFVKAIRHPYEEKKVYFTQMQESCRKDIERAFGVLQARWAVLRGPAYGWDRNRLTEIMTACIIMHNMIVEDEGPFAANIDFGDNSSRIDSSQIIAEGRAEWVINHFDLRRQDRSCSLQNDLVEHLWSRRGSM